MCNCAYIKTILHSSPMKFYLNLNVGLGIKAKINRAKINSEQFVCSYVSVATIIAIVTPKLKSCFKKNFSQKLHRL